MVNLNILKSIFKKVLFWYLLSTVLYLIFDYLDFPYTILPIMGILGGPYGSLGFGLAFLTNVFIYYLLNLMDINIFIHMLTFAIPLFLLPYLFYKIWYSYGDKNRIIHLDSIESILKYLLTLMFISVLGSVLYLSITSFGIYNFEYSLVLITTLYMFNNGLLSIPIILIVNYYNFSFYFPGKDDFNLLDSIYKKFNNFKLIRYMYNNIQIFDYLLILLVVLSLVWYISYIFDISLILKYSYIFNCLILILFTLFVFRPVSNLNISDSIKMKSDEIISFNDIFISFFVLIVIIYITSLYIFQFFGILNNIPRLSADLSILIYIDLFIFILAIPSMLILRYIERRVTNPLNALVNFLDGYLKNNTIPDAQDFIQISAFLKKETEVSRLSKAIIMFTNDLKNYLNNIKELTADKERFEQELNIAHNIQESFLPTDNNINQNIKIDHLMIPAEYVGGDFYDFFMIDENHLAFVIGDVSDKGIPAALFMSKSIQIIESFLFTYSQNLDLADLVYNINNKLCDNNDSCMFVTSWIGILDLRNGELKYVNAGHEYPIVKLNGEYLFLESENDCVLGIMEDEFFKVNELYLNYDDYILLFTDGVTDANDEKRNFFGKERLLNLVKSSGMESISEDLICYIKESVDEFTNNQKQFDDFTLLLVEYKSK